MRIYYGLPQLKCTIEMWVGLDRGGLIASLSIRPLLEFFKVKFGGDVVKYSREIGEILVNIRISLINCQNSDKTGNIGSSRYPCWLLCQKGLTRDISMINGRYIRTFLTLVGSSFS